MRGAILAVGTELLGSDRVESNSLRVAEALERCGVVLEGKGVLPDEESTIADAVRFWLERVELVVLTGGLGPTADDVTREAVARAVHEPLIEDAAVREALVERFRRSGRELLPNQLRQALRPRGAQSLPNPCGTAPGFWWSKDTRHVVALPGVPRELDAMLEQDLVPKLAQLAAQSIRGRRTWVIALLPEGEVDAALEPLYRRLGRNAVTVLAAPGLVRVRVTLGPPSQEMWAAVESQLRELLGPAVFEEGAFGLEGAVVESLRSCRQSVAVAESCTGGGIGARLTRVPGASDVFLGGVIAYANSVKRKLLAVPPEVLEREGAVSGQVVSRMARGAVEQTGADWGIGVSGIAGPGGGTREKPVGTVFLALTSSNGFSRVWAFRFPGDRERVRSLAEVAALELLRRQLLCLEGPVSWSARP